MTEERRYGINWVDLIIKVILLILFVLLICWLFPMPKLDTFYDKVFNENIQTMKNAARNYYTVDRLPSAIGETKTMTLKQLIDSKIILEFSDKDGNACDTANSYVQVTKTLDSEYALKVQLTCGDESDYIIDTIGCNGTCLLSEVNNAKDAAKTENDDSETYNDVKLGGSSPSGNTKYYYYPLGGTTGSTSTTTIIKYPENNTSNNSNTDTNSESRKPNRPNNNNNHSNSNNNNNNNFDNQTLYYQQAKIVKSYGDWIEGYKSGNNIETKTKRVNYYYYTKNSSSSTKQTSEYRTTSYIESREIYNGKQYSYELQLTDIPPTATNVNVVSDRYFSSTDYQKYLNTYSTNLYMSGNDMLHNSNLSSTSQFKVSALKSNNFDYNISNAYKSNGVWRVRVNIYIRSKVGATAYYDRSLNKEILFVPVYFKTNYSASTSGSTKSYLDTEDNSYKYSGYSRSYAYSDTINYYRYVTERVDYNQTKWSTSRYLDGYKFTGNTRYM